MGKVGTKELNTLNLLADECKRDSGTVLSGVEKSPQHPLVKGSKQALTQAVSCQGTGRKLLGNTIQWAQPWHCVEMEQPGQGTKYPICWHLWNDICFLS